MRPISLVFLLAWAMQSTCAAEPANPGYPFWDGSESIAEYAKRANLPATKTMELGDGVRLELVLIPAGTFKMGTPEPEPVHEEGYYDRIRVGVGVLAVGGGLLLGLLGVVLIRAIRRRQRPQYSLAWFLCMTVAAGIGLMGGLHWHYSARTLAEARSEYEVASVRFKTSFGTHKPAHEVSLTQAFYIGEYEVTQEQYQQVMGNNPSRFKGRDLPVETVSWADAQSFCKKVSEKTGLVIRLPTEAEWEHACRAGTRTRYYTGDSDADLDRAGWYDDNSKGATHPVGQKTPNAWGIYDMHGNVWEWCADRFEAYKSDPAVDPQGPSQGAIRVLRGGCWVDSHWHCRSADRDGISPGGGGSDNGFRVVWLVPRTPQPGQAGTK